MQIVGDRFACGDYFIPHLVLAGKAMKSVMRVLEPELKKRKQAAANAGIAVIGTVHGDIHEIGKSLVGIMLTAHGFEVHDLGVDVPATTFVAKVKETVANSIGLSALLTTTRVVQRRVIEALDAEGLRGKVKVMVGGARSSRARRRGLAPMGTPRTRRERWTWPRGWWAADRLGIAARLTGIASSPRVSPKGGGDVRVCANG